jgi:uncharacterized protein
MPYFLYRLTPPRPTFPADITPDEGDAMQRHFGFWQEQVSRGNALVVGPVLEPQGTYGIAVVKAADSAAARAICADDPAVAARLGFTSQLFDMPDTLAQHA